VNCWTLSRSFHRCLEVRSRQAPAVPGRTVDDFLHSLSVVCPRPGSLLAFKLSCRRRTSTDDDSVRAIGLGIVGKSLLVLPPGPSSLTTQLCSQPASFTMMLVAARPYITLNLLLLPKGRSGGMLPCPLVWACYRPVLQMVSG